MTDFVHESPKDPSKESAPKEEKPTTERERMKKVYTYVAILFTVAFLLILWTFLMNQRSSQAIRDEIKSGNHALQSTLEENDSLEARVKELEAQLAAAGGGVVAGDTGTQRLLGQEFHRAGLLERADVVFRGVEIAERRELRTNAASAAHFTRIAR